METEVEAVPLKLHKISKIGISCSFKLIGLSSVFQVCPLKFCRRSFMTWGLPTSFLFEADGLKYSAAVSPSKIPMILRNLGYHQITWIILSFKFRFILIGDFCIFRNSKH